MSHEQPKTIFDEVAMLRADNRRLQDRIAELEADLATGSDRSWETLQSVIDSKNHEIAELVAKNNRLLTESDAPAVSELRGRIAELEAENARLRKVVEVCGRSLRSMDPMLRAEANAAVDELAKEDE